MAAWPAEEARIAEEAGATAVMALERVPADIRKVCCTPVTGPHGCCQTVHRDC